MSSCGVPWLRRASRSMESFTSGGPPMGDSIVTHKVRPNASVTLVEHEVEDLVAHLSQAIETLRSINQMVEFDYTIALNSLEGMMIGLMMSKFEA